jgi:hypothetical protein
MTAARVLPVLGILPLAALMFACQRPTSLKEGPTDVTGTWAVTADNVSGSGLTCSVTGLDVALTQHDDGTFTGIALSGTVICNYFGFQTAQAVDSGTTVIGTVDVTSRAISINVPSVPATLNGTVQPSNMSMNGSTQLVIGVGGGTNITITGPWSAIRTGS